MKGAQPDQAVLSRDWDLTRTAETWASVQVRLDDPNDQPIGDIGPFFAANFRWLENFGCGTKSSLQQVQDNRRRPLRATVSDRVYGNEARLFRGKRAAAFGRQAATDSGEFIGTAPTGKRAEICNMDHWKVSDGKIADNRVMVDFPQVMARPGADSVNSNGWESFDRGKKVRRTGSQRNSP